MPKLKGVKKGELYTVTKMADDGEGAWCIDSFKHNVFIPKKCLELLQDDGVTKMDCSGMNVSFSGLLPKIVNFDEKTRTMTVIW